jgi:hypothetical protein
MLGNKLREISRIVIHPRYSQDVEQDFNLIVVPILIEAAEHKLKSCIIDKTNVKVFNWLKEHQNDLETLTKMRDIECSRSMVLNVGEMALHSVTFSW